MGLNPIRGDLPFADEEPVPEEQIGEAPQAREDAEAGGDAEYIRYLTETAEAMAGNRALRDQLLKDLGVGGDRHVMDGMDSPQRGQHLEDTPDLDQRRNDLVKLARRLNRGAPTASLRRPPRPDPVGGARG